jgi:hypothetical protein
MARDPRNVGTSVRTRLPDRSRVERVRPQWDARVLRVGREVCPRAKWDKAARAWTMTADEAAAFLAAGHTRPGYARDSN